MPTHNKDFAYWWSVEGAWVEEPNERRDGKSGVQFVAASEQGQPNLYIKRQINHCYRTLRHPFGRPTVFREQQATLAFNALGVTTPKLVFCGAEKHSDHWRGLMVTEELHGFISLDDWYKTLAEQQSAYKPELFQKIARMLVSLHKANWQHCCCYGNHIFVRIDTETNSVEVAMLDLEKVRRRWPASSAALSDLDQLSRHSGLMPQDDWLALLHEYMRQFPSAANKLKQLEVRAA